MAAGDSRRCVKNAAFRAVFPIKDTSNALVSGATNKSASIIVDSASPAVLAGTVTEIGSSGIYYVDITAAENTTAGDAHVICTSTEGVTSYLQLPFEPCLESGVAQASGATSLTLRSGASTTDDLYNGLTVEIVRGTGIGQSRVIVDYTGSTRVATTDRAWITNPDTTSVYLITGKQGLRQGTDAMTQVDVQQIDADATAAANQALIANAGGIFGSVDDASPTTTSFAGASGLSTTNDFYNNATLLFTDGNLAGIEREITDYVGSTLTFTTGAYPVAPANGDKFVIIGRVY